MIEDVWHKSRKYSCRLDASVSALLNDLPDALHGSFFVDLRLVLMSMYIFY